MRKVGKMRQVKACCTADWAMRSEALCDRAGAQRMQRLAELRHELARGGDEVGHVRRRVVADLLHLGPFDLRQARQRHKLSAAVERGVTLGRVDRRVKECALLDQVRCTVLGEMARR